MEITSISAAYTALKAVKEVITGLSDLTRETETIGRINDAVKTVSDTQDTLFQLREDLFRLQEENNKLRKEIEEYQSWDKKLNNYELVKTEGKAVVYKSKEEPEHYICPSCAAKRSLEILQDNRAMSGKFRCIGCKGEYPINPAEQMKPLNFDR